MIDPATPDALKAIASMMRMEGYRPDVVGVEALVLENAADELERLELKVYQLENDLALTRAMLPRAKYKYGVVRIEND